jgi:hypothetical protein
MEVAAASMERAVATARMRVD